MKLMWFHLMPYTELPEDFKEKHPSVWVDIHSSLFDPKREEWMSTQTEGCCVRKSSSSSEIGRAHV